MIDEQCSSCPYYDNQYYCNRYIIEDVKNVSESFKTEDGITVVITDKGVIIPIVDVITCEYAKDVVTKVRHFD